MSMSRWRILGRWRDGREFLVTLGLDAPECLGRVSLALSDLDLADWQGVRALTVETLLDRFDELGFRRVWRPVRSLTRLQIRRAQRDARAWRALHGDPFAAS